MPHSYNLVIFFDFLSILLLNANLFLLNSLLLFFIFILVIFLLNNLGAKWIIIFILSLTKLLFKSNILFLFLNNCIMRSDLCSCRRRSNGSIWSSWSYYKFLLIKFSPVWYSLFSTPLPFFFSLNFKLFNHTLHLKILDIFLVFGLLHFYQMILFIIKLFKYFVTNLLIEFWKCRLI